ncbi:FliH/SctL family protein [Rhodococcus sp. X156]|uniref:FliH/SctL family protein n=1 Tax=Rhodococcus sp. X156 TaxID=2499145 RepID=UPI000FDB8D01|nr:FliH/SctL family protein [Rhodococcus sp. X156]
MPDTLAARPAFALAGPSAIPERLVADARSAAEAVGYARGWAQGLAEARRASADALAAARAAEVRHAAERSDSLASAVAALAAAADQLEAVAAPACTQIEDTVLAVALELAQALLGRALAQPAVSGPAALARVLALAPEGEPVSVRLHPRDHAQLSGAGGAEVLAALAGAAGREITLTADAAVAPGDALARCGATSIDARLSAGVARLQEHLAR